LTKKPPILAITARSARDPLVFLPGNRRRGTCSDAFGDLGKGLGGAVAATGLNYDNFRWYDAVNGVFASQDPIGLGGGQANTEAFVGNSPTNFTDPMGLCDCGCPSGGGSRGQVGLMGFGDSGGSIPVYFSGGGDRSGGCRGHRAHVPMANGRWLAHPQSYGRRTRYGNEAHFERRIRNRNRRLR
jgi:RHS repeat-associated protein